jgi:hypothetical protein
MMPISAPEAILSPCPRLSRILPRLLRLIITRDGLHETQANSNLNVLAEGLAGALRFLP